MAGKQRSGMLDLVRFVLTIFVVMVHLIDRSIPSLMILRGGTIAVEFFFVLSGFLLASSADRADKSLPVSESTWHVMKRKVCSIYPTWLAAFLVVIAWQLFVNNTGLKDLLRQVEESTTTFLMISQLGMYDKLVISYSWYIPVMLLCTLMLFPILYKHGKTFAYTVAPLVTLFGFAYLFHSFGKLYTLQSEWLGFTWAATVRGLSEMCLGVVAYAGSRRLTARLNGRLTAAGRVLFTAL
ncbi:MAG: acyltransferase, partial [Clostridia bacterium]|nr:acyltransferase [Clostridia bacterium]